MKSLKYIILCTSLLALSCSTPSKQEASRFQLKPFESTVLENGLRLTVIPDTSLPRVSYQLMINQGSISDPESLSGLTSLTTRLLRRGTTLLSASQVAEAFEELGGEFRESISKDHILVSASGLSPHQDRLFSIFWDVIQKPAFAIPEIEKRKSEALAALARASDEPSSFTDLRLEEVIFSGSSYSRSVTGLETTIPKIKRTEIVKHYRALFRPDQAQLVLSGRLDETSLAQIKKTIAQWKKPATAMALSSRPKLESAKRQIWVFHKPGLEQTQIRFAHTSIARNDPQFLSYRLANMSLGGAFASRLNQVVRDDLGLTYSIYSSVHTYRDTGAFVVSTFTRHDKVKETIDSTWSEITKLQKSGVSVRELQASQAVLKGQFPAALETTDRLGFNLMILNLNGVSESYLHNFFQDVDALSIKEVNHAASQMIRPEDMQIVIHTDYSKTREQIEALGWPLKLN